MLLSSIRSCLSVAKLPSTKGSERTQKVVRVQQKRSLRIARQRQFSRAYCSKTSKEDVEEAAYEPDLTREDYGMSGVQLDTKKYYEAFADTKHFQRPEELAWMLWQPPKSILRPDEWLEMRTSMTQNIPGMKGKDALLLFILSMSTSQNFSGVKDAFLSTIEHVNDGDIEALEKAMHPTCYHYVKGWLNYMKEQGYTWKHQVEEVTSVNKFGATALTMEGDLDDITSGSYIDGPAISRWAPSSPKNSEKQSISKVSFMQWVEIVAKEKFEIRDKKGSIVISSPLKKQRHFWKFGTQALKSGAAFLEQPETLSWTWRLFDIDNQVILRATDILTQDKLFLDSAAPRDEVWHLTKALGV